MDRRDSRAVRFLFSGAVLLACAVLAAPAGATSAERAVPAVQPTSLELGVLASLNDVRVEHGLSPISKGAVELSERRSGGGRGARCGWWCWSRWPCPMSARAGAAQELW